MLNTAGVRLHLHKSFDFVSATEERPTINLIRSSRPGGRAVHEKNPALLHLTCPSCQTLHSGTCGLSEGVEVARPSFLECLGCYSWLGSCLTNLMITIITMITIIILMMTICNKDHDL